MFKVFKYLIYLGVFINGVQFILKDFSAAEQTLNHASNYYDILKTYAISIDTVAWLVLLLIYELETYVVSDDQLKGGVKWTLYSATAICYVSIAYALIGYVGKILVLQDHIPLSPADIQLLINNQCNFADTALKIMNELDSYSLLDQANCNALEGTQLFQLNSQPIVFHMENYNGFSGMLALAWADAINSGAWLLVAFFIQMDIVLQIHGKLTPSIHRTSTIIKSIFYLILLTTAIYWGISGEMLDFWDAFLWLLGFIFIDLNIMNWNKETRNEDYLETHNDFERNTQKTN